MTIAIPIGELAATITRFGSAVLVVGRSGDWPRVLTVDPRMDGETVVVPGLRGNPGRWRPIPW